MSLSFLTFLLLLSTLVVFRLDRIYFYILKYPKPVVASPLTIVSGQGCSSLNTHLATALGWGGAGARAGRGGAGAGQGRTGLGRGRSGARRRRGGLHLPSRRTADTACAPET